MPGKRNGGVGTVKRITAESTPRAAISFSTVHVDHAILTSLTSLQKRAQDGARVKIYLTERLSPIASEIRTCNEEPRSPAQMPALAQDALMGHYYAPKAVDSFDRLVQDLSDTLGPSSGLDSADVNPRDLQTLMEEYGSSPSEWARYAWSDDSRAYTRNLVDRGNGKSNLVGRGE